jgi:hypothetical protein
LGKRPEVVETAKPDATAIVDDFAEAVDRVLGVNDSRQD